MNIRCLPANAMSRYVPRERIQRRELGEASRSELAIKVHYIRARHQLQCPGQPTLRRDTCDSSDFFWW